MHRETNKRKHTQPLFENVSQKNNADAFQFDDQRPENEHMVQLQAMMLSLIHI